MRRLRVLAVLIVAAAVPWLGAGGATAKEYLLTGTHPNNLILVDPAARKVERVYPIPGPGYPLTIAPSPDGKIAYVITNRWESVSGIDLDTGKEVFRADFSSADMRVKATFAMDISPDGKELYIFHSPVKLLPSEYVVQDTYIAVYNTADGIGAKPVRTFPAPRGTSVLMSSVDGSKLYAHNGNLNIFDPRTGRQIGVHKLRDWERPNATTPDILTVWPQWEQTNIFSDLYFTVLTDVDPEDPAAYKFGIYTLDLETGAFSFGDYENAAVIIFSSVVNPVRRNELFAVYTQLSKIDRETLELVKRVDLDHTYYCINVSSDGSEVYIGGTMGDIAVYATETLEKLGTIEMPGGADQSLASLRIIHR